MLAIRSLFVILFLAQSFAMQAGNPPRERIWEYLINERVMDYPLRQENLFRLAVYTELKGHYLPGEDALSLEFGSLARMQFFSEHCLVKTSEGRVFSLKRGAAPSNLSATLDASLDELFDRMPLLNDGSADPTVVELVDAHLARKNLEPFDKLFLRHLLVHYGRYNADQNAIEFYSDWVTADQQNRVSMPGSPLKIRLDQNILRGYYLDAGGTVYVEDVPRTVAYATGEEYGHNVTAFKVFMEKLLVRSVQYVVQEESSRSPVAAAAPARQTNVEDLPFGYQQQMATGQGSAAGTSVSTQEVESLYAPQKWMSLMLSMLRARDINIGDNDVIRYFADQDYFPQLYELMLPEERERADRYLNRHGLAAQP